MGVNTSWKVCKMGRDIKTDPQRFIKSGCKKAQKQIFNGWIGIEG